MKDITNKIDEEVMPELRKKQMVSGSMNLKRTLSKQGFRRLVAIANVYYLNADYSNLKVKELSL